MYAQFCQGGPNPDKLYNPFHIIIGVLDTDIQFQFHTFDSFNKFRHLFDRSYLVPKKSNIDIMNS